MVQDGNQHWAQRPALLKHHKAYERTADITVWSPAPPSPAQSSTDPTEADASTGKWREHVSRRPAAVFLHALGSTMLALRSGLRTALAPRALAPQVGLAGVCESRAQGGRGCRLVV